MRKALRLAGALWLCGCGSVLLGAAQEYTVPGHVVISLPKGAATTVSSKKRPDYANVAVWLLPLDENGAAVRTAGLAGKPPQLIQRNKTFEPHVLVIRVGTKVEFPNKDPFFHNIFSFYDGKRFDLGLYEAGSTRTVLFDRPGVSYLFCNIHAEMSAVVVAVQTPYFGLSNTPGNLSIPNVPNGRYELHAWFERGLPEALKGLDRVVVISDKEHDLGTIRVEENPNFSAAHKNKYGLDYVPPPTTTYEKP